MLPARRRARAALLALTLVLFGPACSGGDAGTAGDRPRVAYITNGVADFWTIAKAGAEAAGRELDVSVQVLMPAGGAAAQKEQVEDCLTKRVDGIALSPIDPANQGELIGRACAGTRLITHDSDAPGTPRLCYVGVNNYDAGRMCGELAKTALPDGGKIAIFIGRLEQENGRLRRQGVVDAVLGRSHDPKRFDPADVVLKSGDGRTTIVGTYTDQFDWARSKANVEDALSRHPDLACCVGLFGYNPPLIIEALKGAGKLGVVKVVAFDEDAATLQGIADGTVVGTVVQNPWRYGYESVRILAGLTRGSTLAELGVSDEGFLDVEARVIGPDEVADFRAELDANLGR